MSLKGWIEDFRGGWRARMEAEKRPCRECGHVHATMRSLDVLGESYWLCHEDYHSCYDNWRGRYDYLRRPSTPPQEGQ